MQDDRLQGRIAVMTGSSSRLGRAMAIKFASGGARVVCADLRPEARPMTAHKSPSTPTHELINETYKGEMPYSCRLTSVTKKKSKP